VERGLAAVQGLYQHTALQERHQPGPGALEGGQARKGGGRGAPAGPGASHGGPRALQAAGRQQQASMIAVSTLQLDQSS
jgi:hypothetical protein